MIHVIGIGPGDPSHLTPRARRLLSRCDLVLGYRRYVDLIEEGLPEATLDSRRYDIGQEQARADDALRAARRGRRVALISGGDAGVYGMAPALFERLDPSEVEVEVCPGVTALTAAAALLGSPVGQDFCAISLSDLLTPWPRIRKRVHHAAAGDFVIGFYNPRSSQRTHQLGEALEIVRQQRSDDTPVGIVRKAYREGQSRELRRLEAVPVGQIDMLSLVLVGNSRTRIEGKWMVTPRGYGEGATP